ncbi:MAG: 2-C-methyl-D-erythritol 4-phosphate cytidylyltransferase [Elusimicrobiota bacterium]|jgi:2-C-methyl-D-erythritol 4-phosphate cytidylyltransferase|nr:2-C-methyl-D-erythritol 4-phosphate cytidylyltransferase [Elusimicrobiota bacterium]
MRSNLNGLNLEVIIVAAGAGKRFKGLVPKQFLNLGGMPVFWRSVLAFLDLKETSKIIVVVPQKYVKVLSAKYKSFTKVIFVCGGKERFDSVREGLKRVSCEADFIAVHDGARPLINVKDIRAVFLEACKTSAAIAACKTKDTIKAAVGQTIKKTIDRTNLWNAQTPQIFKTDLILMAYKKSIAKNITDDSELIEKLKKKVSLVELRYPNFKITNKEDFALAQFLIEQKNSI